MQIQIFQKSTKIRIKSGHQKFVVSHASSSTAWTDALVYFHPIEIRVNNMRLVPTLWFDSTFWPSQSEDLRMVVSHSQLETRRLETDNLFILENPSRFLRHDKVML